MNESTNLNSNETIQIIQSESFQMRKSLVFLLIKGIKYDR